MLFGAGWRAHLFPQRAWVSKLRERTFLGKFLGVAQKLGYMRSRLTLPRRMIRTAWASSSARESAQVN
jgi:hypothetical protein